MLFASAGIGHFGIGLDTITPEEVTRVFDVNVKGTIAAAALRNSPAR